MARLLLTPRWVASLVLLLLIVAACVWLGRWQWESARAESVRTPPGGVASLTDVHLVGQPVTSEDAGRSVTMRGQFDAERQVLVIDRQDEGRTGHWVVTAFELSPEDGGDAATIPVVRGWLPDGETPPTPTSTVQRVVGTLEPSESEGLRQRDRAPLPDGQLEIVSSPELLSLWRPPLYQGFVVQERPQPDAPLEPVTIPLRSAVVTDWQNAAYAVQWWLFGLFAIFWFVRLVRIELEDQRLGSNADSGTQHGKMHPPATSHDPKESS